VRLLIIDIESMGLDLALRAIADGHEVKLWQDWKRPIGRGVPGLTRVQDWRAHMISAKDGLVVMTGNAKFCREMDRYRDFGWNIFGPTEASAKLEIDRKAGMDAMEAAGIEIPPYECFPTLDAAKARAGKADEAFVFKCLGSEDDKSCTHVADSPEDMVAWIERKQKGGWRPTGQVMLQSKIDMLAEYGASGWCGPGGFLADRWQVCWEHKRLMNGEVGPQTGEMGSVTCYVEDDPCAEMLMQLEPVLRTLGHRGDFAIGVGIDRKGNAWPFEFTARCGWPAFFNQVASHKGDVCQWMLDLCKGEDSLKVDRRPCVSVVMAQPPFPQWNGKPESVEGNPIAYDEDEWDNLHPAMCMRAGDEWHTCGELVCVATGLGKTISKAREQVYATVKATRFTDAMYRTDIGEKVEDSLAAIQAHGFAQGIIW